MTSTISSYLVTKYGTYKLGVGGRVGWGWGIQLQSKFNQGGICLPLIGFKYTLTLDSPIVVMYIYKVSKNDCNTFEQE